MHKPALFLFTGLLLAAVPPASAMYLNPQGSGQVLLFPYFTVNAGQVTLVSLSNTTGRAKYLTASFREGYNSRGLIEFGIMLAPHDSWTGVLYTHDDSDAAWLLTRDESCLAPDTSRWNAAPGGGWQMRLFDRAYTAGNVDGGPTDLTRTREGHLTVVERAELGGVLAAAVGNGEARDCSRLQNVAPHSTDLLPPGGGIYGNFSIVDVAEGTLLGGRATAIADFSRRPLFWSTADIKELLTLGMEEDGNVAAQVFSDGELMEVAYSGRETNLPRPFDAVSALLMTESLYGDFERDDDYGSRSEWVITAPTKFFYTDKQVLGMPAGAGPGLPPFRDVFNSVHQAGSCMPFTVTAADREGRPIRFDRPFALDPPPPPPRYPSHNLCHATNVVYFDNAVAAGTGTPVLGSRLGVPVWHPSPYDVKAGSVRLELGVRRDFVSWDGGGEQSSPSFLPPGTRGPGLRGLPVIGFQAVRYINGSLEPGLLANYTRAVPLNGAAPVCTDAAGEAVACP